MPALRNDWPDLLEPGFREIYNDAFEEKEQVFPQIFHILSSDKQDEKDSGATGFGLFAQTGENEQVDYEEPLLKLAAYGRDAIRKPLKLRETLYQETIRSQIPSGRGSETVIGASRVMRWMMGQSELCGDIQSQAEMS